MGEDTGPQGELQFDRVIPVTEADTAPSGATVTCANCGASISGTYFAAGPSPVCLACKASIQSSVAGSKKSTTFLKATAFGLGAAILGAALYYAVIAITDLEIGIVAIAIGYMVGWAVRKGTNNWGGRRYQVLALVLTYFSVGLAYTPLLYKGLRTGNSATGSADSSAAAAFGPGDSSTVHVRDRAVGATIAVGDSASTPATGTGAGGMGLWVALGALTLLVFALPVMSVVSSLPGGLLSAAIIGFGMRQAWQLTAPASLAITGPYAVGQAPPATSS